MTDEKKPYVTNLNPVNPSKDLKVAPPRPVLNEVPDGAIDINQVRPGYGPLEGSPKENDPSQLANPNNPLSPITVPVNPSNPANPPNTQSDKPASEVRIHNDLLALKSGQNITEASKVIEDRKKRATELYTRLDKLLKDNGDRESSIPANSEYWGLINELRVLNNP